MTAVRVALLTEIPAPFRIPLFNDLARREGVELEVLFLRQTNPQRPYALHDEEFAFRWRVLQGVDVTRGRRWLILNAGTLRTLRRLRPDVVLLGGWNQPAFWAGLAYAHATGRAAVAWVESTARDARPEGPALERAKRAFLRRCDAFVVPGRASAEYLAALGIDEEQITVAPNAVDMRIFGVGVADERRRRDEIRAGLGLTGCVVLFVGRLEPEKGADVLIRALDALPDAVTLVVAGHGEERQALERLAARHAPGRVRFLGFVPRDELVPWYAATDVFALPSRSEQWGMALNEAAAAGLPLVATDAAGAARELIEEGENGFRVPPDDPTALATAIGRLANDEALRLRAGASSAELAARLTPERWGEAVERLARSLVR